MSNSRIDVAGSDLAGEPDTEVYLKSEQGQERLAAIAADIDFADPALTITYGARVMAETAKFAEELLAQVRAQDDGPLRRVLVAFAAQLKNMDIAGLAQEKPGWSSRLPVLGGMFDPLSRAGERFNVLVDDLGDFTDSLQTALDAITRDIEIMEQLHELNREFYRQLSLNIEAGKERLAAIQTSDYTVTLSRFEARLYDLQLSRAAAAQTAPKIRLIQSNDQKLAKRLKEDILATLPAWKDQMALALAGREAKQASEKAEHPSNLKTLHEIHIQLIETVEDTLLLISETGDSRCAVEEELSRMEGDLRGRLACRSENNP